MAPALNLTAEGLGLNTSLHLNASLNSTLTTSLPEAFGTVKPLMLAILAIALYSLFVFKFYRFLAERDILKLKWHRKYSWHEGFLYKAFKTFFYLVENVVLIPVLVFFWFAVLAALLLFLSKNPPDQIMLISMAIIGAVRISAYYKEDLSRDLAKMIPFALLAVFIVDMSYFSFANTWESFRQVPQYLNNLIFYLVFVAGLELVMRILRLIKLAIKPDKEEEKKEED